MSGHRAHEGGGAPAVLRRHGRLIGALCIALPLLALAVRDSLAWPSRVFPGFLLMRNGVVPTVSGFDWPPDREALFHSQVIAVDGAPVHGGAEVYAHIAGRTPGTDVHYTVRREGVVSEVVLPVRRFGGADWLQTFGVLLGFGCAWLAGGLVVALLRPDSTPARIFLLQSVVGGLFPITAVFLYGPGSAPVTPLHLAIECLFPATIAHLALVFPVERLRGWRRAAAVAPAYALSALLAAWAIIGFDAAPPDLTAIYRAYQFAGLSFVLLIGMLALTLARAGDAATRARALAVLPGAMLAGTLALFAVLDAAVSGRQFPLQFGLLFTPLFLAGIGYAVARHNLFDVDRIVRQAFVYTALSVVVIAAYATIVSTTAQWSEDDGGAGTLLRGVGFLLLALLLEPLRRRIQTAIDRTFYRARLSYRKTIAALSDALTTLLDLEEVVDQVTRVLNEAMQLEWTALVVLPDGDDPGHTWVRRAGQESESSSAPAAGFAFTAALGASRQPWDPEALATARDILNADRNLPDLDVRMVLPLAAQRRMVGVLLLGARRSGRSFGAEDVELLRTLANQTGIAVQNARSYRQLADLTRTLDAKVRDQTAALRASNAELSDAYAELQATQGQLVQSEKMASLGQLVAGAAHELNNPASFVHGGIETIASYLERLLEMLAAYEAAAPRSGEAAQALDEIRTRLRIERVVEETPTLLRICAEGSGRIKGIVDDLRVFVRADSGPRAQVSISEGIDATLRLLAHRLLPARITIDTDYADLPHVAANAGQLNQVWMNLISNAADAVVDTPAPCIRIATRQVTDNGGSPLVEVEVADNGRGISAEALPRIFDPFFTTKPVGSGTGLGLSIAYGAVKAHNGAILVESGPGRGTTIRVRLPLS